MATYRIVDGVHRCVAARFAGITEIRAQVDDGNGVYGDVELVSLDVIYSSKAEIGLWDRGRDFFELVKLMSNERSRDLLPPIVLLEVSERYLKYLTLVEGVTVNRLK